MPRWLVRLYDAALFVLLILILASCAATASGAGTSGSCTPAATPVINFAAYSTPRQVYGKIPPRIPVDVEGRARRSERDHPGVVRRLDDATQNVVNGYAADIAALSLAPGVDQVAHELLGSIDLGTVILTLHDGRVVQVETSEKIRLR